MSKDFQGTHSPPLNAYNPNTSLTEKSDGAVKFGTSKQRDLRFITTMTDRSPGPIYNIKSEMHIPDAHIGSNFGRSKRDVTPPPNPPPGAYSPILRSHHSHVTIKGSYSLEKVYSRNYERYMKGKVSPGPAKYNISDTKILKSIHFSKVGREAYESN